MEINKKDLRKISRNFRAIASRVSHAHFREQKVYLQELMNFVDDTDIIRNYIDSLYDEITDLEQKVKDVIQSYGGITFQLGSSKEERINFLYQLLSYVVKNEIEPYGLGCLYTSSSKCQDMANEFGNRLVMAFVRDIESYLNDVFTDMGYDENSMFNINVNSSGVQVNIANDHSRITATQDNSIDHNKLTEALDSLNKMVNDLENSEEKSVLASNLKVVSDELSNGKPKTQVVETCIQTMSTIASRIAMLPAFSQGLKMIGAMIGVFPK